MKKKVVILIIHAIVFALAVIIAAFEIKGKNYFRYIYMMDSLFRNEYGLTTCIAAVICDIILIIADAICSVSCIVKIISNFIKRKSFCGKTRELLYWGIMTFVALTAFVIYCKYYVAFL